MPAQVKATVASLTGIDVRCMYLDPIESPATSLYSNGMTVTEVHWFERRHELRLKAIEPDALDGCPAQGPGAS